MLQIFKNVPAMLQLSTGWKGEWGRFCHLAKIQMTHRSHCMKKRIGSMYGLTVTQKLGNSLARWSGN